jgi:2-polyprenyl-3-methyl-5-hydroxy-6-metoxy-1,4-benzoquinol methylase
MRAATLGGAGGRPGERSREARWSSEAAFFDRIADGIAPDEPIDPLVVERYRASRRPWFNKEFRFQLVGDVRDRAVLDVGCGPGDNALLLASFGARVTGIDVSPGCIETARRRARASGLAGRIQLECAPLETADLAPASFDVVWGDGVLHHLVDDLDAVLRRLVSCAKPGALFVFSEPVAYVRALRVLRRWVPVHTDATPDERPLEPPELALLRAHLPDLRAAHFGLLGRVVKHLIPGSYERLPRSRQVLTSAAHRVDSFVAALPGLRSLAGEAVLWGHARAA